MLKIWLREPHHTDEEAIKLLIEDTADVSDVLLRAPDLLRVQHLKPAELQVVFRGNVLSNRRQLTDVLCGEADETFVIQPRADRAETRALSAARSGVADDAQRRGRQPLFRASSPSKAVASRPGVARSPMRSARSSAPLASKPGDRPSSVTRASRTASKETASRAVSSYARQNTATQTPRTTTSGNPPLHPRGPSASAPRATLPPSGFGATPQRNTSVPRRQATPQRSESQMRRSTPQGTNHEAPSQSSLRSFPRAAESATPAPAERAKKKALRPMSARLMRLATLKPAAPPKREEVSVICNDFKPQWGNVLCAVCKHSKQAHWMQEQERKAEALGATALDSDVFVDPMDSFCYQARYPPQTETLSPPPNTGEVFTVRGDGGDTASPSFAEPRPVVGELGYPHSECQTSSWDDSVDARIPHTGSLAPAPHVPTGVFGVEVAQNPEL